jgi:hypothetical protein
LLLSKYNANDNDLFPSWVQTHSGTIITKDSKIKWWINRIIDERKCGHGYQYLVHLVGKGPENNLWLPQWEVKHCKALDVWLEGKWQLWFFFLSFFHLWWLLWSGEECNPLVIVSHHGPD